MKNNDKPYQHESELDMADIVLDRSKFEISQVNDKSLEIISEIISFLYKADKQLSGTKNSK